MSPGVTIQATGNLLTITFRGKLGVAEMANYVADLDREAAGLPKGFVLYTDITDLEGMDLACSALIRKGMTICRTKGVSTIVRVVPDLTRDPGFNIMSLFHYPRSVKIHTCQTRAEADKILVTLTKK